MNIYKLYSKYFLSLLVSMLAMVAVTSCSDDDEELMQSGYGYVQFKLSKSTSAEAQSASRTVTDRLERLADAKKIQVVLLHDGTTVSQTLLLNSYNDTNAEFGVRSDKLQLVAGVYRVVGYYLYDGVDELLYTGGSGDNSEFTVVSGGLHVQDLSANAASQGMVKFQLEKVLKSRATEEGYLFSSIAEVDVQVKNMFTREVTAFEKLKVTYETGYEESVGVDNPDDKYKEIGKASCDSVVWLPAGTYQVISYSAYSRSGASRSELESQVVVNGESFVVADNMLTEDAVIPIQLSETSENIKDYKALKEIWDKLGGKNWSYFGQEYPEGTNWNFNKELDMWGDQPGVTLDDHGRVTGLALSNFGISGFVPAAIGQLTELQILSLGSHDEKVGGGLFGKQGIAPGMSEDRKQQMRRHYENMFLKHDLRADLSEMLQELINNDPAKKQIQKKARPTLKDTQIGVMTSNLTGVSRAVMRLTKLQQLYIANAPIVCNDAVDNFFTSWEENGADSEYAKAYSQEEAEGKLSWSNMTDLTDIEVYNCKNLEKLPAFLYDLPEIQLLNIACNTGIKGDQLKEDWTALANDPDTGPKIQILYMGYNNLEEFPGYNDPSNENVLKNMKKLGLLDLTNNKVKHLMPFGTDIKLATLYLQNNQIEEVPAEFCGFTNDVETFNFSNNKITYIPNIFDASSLYIMGSIDFSNNRIGENANDSDKDGIRDVDEADFKGINANELSLANNRIANFPKELFKSNSPITVLNMSGNLLTKIDGDDLRRSEAGKEWCPLETFDLRFNKLTEISGENFNPLIPYLQGIDLSYNCFSKFPTNPLNIDRLMAFAIRHQRDAQGERCLKEWPEGINAAGSCPNLYWFQIGSNDIRLVEEAPTTKIYMLDIADNPNITIDLTNVCSAISAGAYLLYYDKTQDIRGCDILLE